MLKLGYKASDEQFAPTELLGYGVLAEEAGFDSVFVSDHLQPWRHDGGHAPIALPGSARRCADRPDRHGHLVLTPTFRYHPAVVAQAFATLGCLFPGRVVLGVGSGESLNEVAAGYRLARRQGALRPVQGGRQPDQPAVDRGTGSPYEGLLPDRRATIYDRPERPVPDTSPAPDRPRPGTPAGGRRLHHHSAGRPEPVHRHTAACGA